MIGMIEEIYYELARIFEAGNGLHEEFDFPTFPRAESPQLPAQSMTRRR
jgi:hypothetical protein